METVGVRELKDRLSRHLRRVKAGAEVVITEHGRPIARLSPLPALPSGLREMMARGELIPGGGGKPKGARIRLRGRGPTAAEVVSQLRD
ncbi:MAG TPA: type II toxin-antitoxin system prevent-host-death family antitoxin [Terriglobales bacterium]|nr:type II toxin-antitoxin system prevent-host-death family antitoxin [Terriglobales bacterium]